MPDGAVVKGAQGNFPLHAANAYNLSGVTTTLPPAPLALLNRALWGTPWLKPDPIDQLTTSDLIAVHKTLPPGVVARQRATLFVPTQTQDLIGVKDRKYLDRSGIAQRDIGDLMRYA
jgi:hypothetical protein